MTPAFFVSAVVVLSACAGPVAPLEDAGPVSASDAGTTDAGPGPVDAGPVACPPTAALCESFEDGLDLDRWSMNGDAATFVIDATTPTPSGQKSLHVRYGLPRGHAGQQSIELKGRVAAPDDRMYLRTYLRFGDLSLTGPHPFFIDVSDRTGRELGFGSIINDFAFMASAPQGLDDSRTWYEGDGSWHPGVESFGPENVNLDLWFDGIVFSTQRVGCL